MRRLFPALALVFLACTSRSPAVPEGVSSIECPAPIGRIAPEDCDRAAARFDGAKFSTTFPIGASGGARDQSIREADRTAGDLRDERVRLCTEKNTCKRPPAEIDAEEERLDQSLLELLKLKELLAQKDAEGGFELLTELHAIHASTSHDAASQPSFLDDVGCSDGEREGFTPPAAFPKIAACAGGWSVPGVLPGAPAACSRNAGDDSPNPKGVGCSASDLCAHGWHVCATSREVAARTKSGCAGAFKDGAGFFATGQSGGGNNECGGGGDDLFGCGTLGAVAGKTCGPLDRSSNNQCSDLGPVWSCGRDASLEAKNVVKTESTTGGVLCCKD